jgi:5'-nucleotidase/UDP-sugar diphosphatase
VLRSGLVVVCAVGVLSGCAERYPAPVTQGRDLRLTILHTTDIHSRLLPYDFEVLAGDEDLGLLQENSPFGGIARMATVIERERGRSARSIYVDSGDCFQGAPIFNAFLGEAEQRALSQLRPDAVVIGNHEFDEGLGNYVKQLDRWATYPLVAANYLFEPGERLGQIAQPVEVINADGMRIGIIGVGNFSSLSSITDIGNSLHIVPLDIVQTVQDWIDILRPHVDLIVAVSHAGLGEDEDMIRATEGLDIVMGGHLHIVLMPPKVIPDRTGRPVILAHSGAFAKFVGRLDVVVRDGEVVAHDYNVVPIDSHVVEDPGMLDLIEPYARKLHQTIDLKSVYGYATRVIRRFGFDGGDSPLGNMVAEAIRQYARADFGMTNSLGIRTDLNPGAITLDQLYNIFPFNNYVTTMYLSGQDVQELLDFSTRRSAGRGCSTQIQVSGIEFVMDCAADPPVARDIVFTNCGDPEITDATGCVRRPLDPNAVYEMATNDYIASGGSGFTVLKVNNTQIDTDVALRDAVLETVLRSDPCIEECRAADGSLQLEGCVGFESCVADVSAFYAADCLRVAQTTPGERVAIPHCPVDLGGQCGSTSACRVPAPCTAATCTACDLATPCPEGQLCAAGFCQAQNIVCASTRCERTCETDADCPGAGLTLAPGQQLCVAGVCEPREGASCKDDASCIDVAAVCPGDACTACETALDCGSEALCSGGRCVVPVATCRDSRCRLPCASADDCHPGEQCGADGRCLPIVCAGQADRGVACELDASWRALERCLGLPCARAEADGRIGRILPPNLEDLPVDGNPDDDL